MIHAWSLASLILLASLAPVVSAQGGGAVGNLSPTFEAFSHGGNNTPSQGTHDVFSGIVRDRNGEADIEDLALKVAAPATSLQTRVVTAADRSTGTEPASFTDGWKVWNPVPGDGRLSFRYNHTYVSTGHHVVHAIVHDEASNQTSDELSIFVGAIAATLSDATPAPGINATYTAQMPDPVPDVPSTVGFPGPAPTASGGIGLVAATFNASGDPAATLDITLDVLDAPSDVPVPPAGTVAAMHLDIRLRLAGTDTPALPQTITIQFSLRQAWITANCPPASCTVNLLHFASLPAPGAWEVLDANVLGDPNAEPVTFESTVTSLSPFIIGGVRTPVAPVQGGGGGGGGADPVPSTSAAAAPTSNAAVPLVDQTAPESTAATNESVPIGQQREGGDAAAQADTPPWLLLSIPILLLLLVGLGLSTRARKAASHGLQAGAVALRRRLVRNRTVTRVPPGQAPPSLSKQHRGASQPTRGPSVPAPATARPNAPPPPTPVARPSPEPRKIAPPPPSAPTVAPAPTPLRVETHVPTPATPEPNVGAQTHRPPMAQSGPARPAAVVPPIPTSTEEPEPTRSLRITDLAQNQWDDVRVFAARPATPTPAPKKANPPSLEVRNNSELDEATQRLAEAIDSSWDNVEIVTPRGKKLPPTRENHDKKDS